MIIRRGGINNYSCGTLMWGGDAIELPQRRVAPGRGCQRLQYRGTFGTTTGTCGPRVEAALRGCC